jgi:chromosome segregation ATPase
MALGIKKITESVIEDNRSLIMIGTLNATGKKIDFNDNKAVPEGAILAAIKNDRATLLVKKTEEEQLRIDASTSIAQESITKNELGNSCVVTEKVHDLAITTDKINNNAVVTSKIKNDSVTRDKLHPDIRKELDNLRQDLDRLRRDHDNLRDEFEALKVDINKFKNDFNKHKKDFEDFKSETQKLLKDLEDKLVLRINKLEEKLRQEIDNKIEENNSKLHLKNAVFHDGKGNVNGVNSSKLINLKCTGEIEGQKVYFMTYK